MTSTANKFLRQTPHIGVVGDNPTFEKNFPQAPEIEKAVLGAILLEKPAHDFIPNIEEDFFYHEACLTIFKVIKELYDEKQSIDQLTVVNRLRQKALLDKADGIQFVSRLTINIMSAAHIEAHIRILHEIALRRRVIRLSDASLAEAYQGSDNIFDVIDRVQSNFLKLNAVKQEKTISIGNSLVQLFDFWQNPNASKQGIMSGYRDIDRRTGGFQKGDLIILAARPSMGKTALALNMMLNISLKNTPTAIMSIETSIRKIAQRCLSIFSGKKAPNNPSEKEINDLAEYANYLGQMPLYIDDTEAISINVLAQKIRTLHKHQKVEFFVVDYLQLIEVSDKESRIKNREQEVAFVVKKLKALAKELDVVIVALSQLSRANEGRADKRPMSSDLRESGFIEQTADIIIMLHRPEYYNIMVDENGESLQGLAELIFTKFRDGEVGSDWLEFSKMIFKDREYFKKQENESQTNDKNSTPF